MSGPQPEYCWSEKVLAQLCFTWVSMSINVLMRKLRRSSKVFYSLEKTPRDIFWKPRWWSPKFSFADPPKQRKVPSTFMWGLRHCFYCALIWVWVETVVATICPRALATRNWFWITWSFISDSCWDNTNTNLFVFSNCDCKLRKSFCSFSLSSAESDIALMRGNQSRLFS